MSDLAAQLFGLFLGRENRHAVATDLGFRPTRRPLLAEDIRDHLKQRRCYGFYVLRPDSTVWVSAVDFDAKHEADWWERALAVAKVLRNRRACPLLELSQSGEGAHVWVRFHEPLPAGAVRRWWRAMLAAANTTCREVFPKQDVLPAGGWGNLIRYPLWGKSRFLGLAGSTLAPPAALESWQTTPAALILAYAASPVGGPGATGTDIPDRVARVVSAGVAKQRWEGVPYGLKDQSPSSVAYSLACELVRAFVPPEDVATALQIWGREHDSKGKTRRPDWVARTIRRAYESVAGRRQPPPNPPPSAARVRRVATVRREEVSWLWPHRVALGKLTLIVGDPELGKSLITMDMASRVTRGAKWPDGACCPRGGVLVLSAEDDPNDTIRPRLEAAGADLDRVALLESVREDGTGRERQFSLVTDVGTLAAEVAAVPDCCLVVIDPVSAYMDRIDSNNNTLVRGLLSPLAAMAARLRVAVVLVSHLRKQSEGPVLYRAMGSLAFTAAARAAWMVIRDQNDPDGDRRLFLPVKNNLTADRNGSAYRIRDRNGGPYVDWEDRPVVHRPDG